MNGLNLLILLWLNLLFWLSFFWLIWFYLLSFCLNRQNRLVLFNLRGLIILWFFFFVFYVWDYDWKGLFTKTFFPCVYSSNYANNCIVKPLIFFYKYPNRLKLLLKAFFILLDDYIDEIFGWYLLKLEE